MIQSIGRTILAAQSWPTMDLAEVARSLAGPFNDDYNQFHSCYQCHGSPLGKVYVNTPWPAVCFDVDNEVLYLKQDLEISHNGWQSAAVPPVNDPVFDNLTHYWSLDEASGTRADSKGSINLSEVGGTVSSGTGKDGNAVDFNTANRWLVSSTFVPFRATTFVSLWLYIRTLPASTKAYSIILDTVAVDRYLWIDDSGNVVFNDSGDPGNGDNNITLPLGALNTWHLVVAGITDDGVTQTAYLSVDGSVFSTTDAANYQFPQTGSNPWRIGAVETVFFNYPTVPDGLIDEFGVYTTALTQGNVTTLWNGGAGKFYRP